MLHEILITDKGLTDYKLSDQFFGERDAWAQQYCPSYVGYHVQDVSDVSYQWDEIGCYQFTDQKCANWFQLRWKVD